jgi:dimethylglycine dehydrogenase
MASPIPKVDGRIALAYSLSKSGGVHSEFTVTKESDHSFYIVSAGAFKRLDHDWIKKHLPEDGSVRFDDLTTQMGVLVLAGPNSRNVLEKCTRDDVSNEGFPWLRAREIDIGWAPVKAIRVNFVGELGWEIHHPLEMQNHLFDTLMQAGAEFGIKPFGIRAMDSMRLEKSYRMPGAELSIEYAAYESGLDRFISKKKENYLHKAGLDEWQKRGFNNSLVTIEVHDPKDADPVGNNPIYKDGQLVGRATSGGFGFRTQKSLALAMVKPDLAKEGTELEIDILGTIYKASIIPDSPFDPENKRLRGLE